MSDPFIAEIRIFAGNFAPRSWAFCDGQLLQISTNTAFFALVGTTYGGDGRTTFGVPDFRGRIPMHAGQGPGLSDRRLGERSGAETVTLTTNQIPSHTHAATAGSPIPATDDDPDAGAILGTTVGGNAYAPAANLEAMADQAVLPTGGGQPHDNLQPFLVLNFIIALTGIFPSRS